jgi:methionyl-tRNA formyltransferase
MLSKLIRETIRLSNSDCNLRSQPYWATQQKMLPLIDATVPSVDLQVLSVRIIFLGTPSFAVPTLQALIDSQEDQVVAVLCQPDRPAGRGNKLHEPPVKLLAAKHNIPVFQPTKLSKSPEIVESMRALEADVIVMVAFGQILKKEVLHLTKYGVINIHASLLPKYRGAAPINWAIIKGEKVSGITTMFTEAGVDTGPMLLKKETEIGPDMNAEELSAELSQTGAQLLMDTLSLLRKNELVPERQDDSQATFAPMLDRTTGEINWSTSGQNIHDMIRGLLPWPCAHATFQSSPVKLLKTKRTDKNATEGRPGVFYLEGDKVYVSCGEDGQELLELIEVQPPSKQRMSARSWVNGLRLKGGEEFK